MCKEKWQTRFEKVSEKVYSEKLQCSQFSVLPTGCLIREVGLFLGLTIEGVKGLFSEVSHSILKIRTHRQLLAPA